MVPQSASLSFLPISTCLWQIPSCRLWCIDHSILSRLRLEMQTRTWKCPEVDMGRRLAIVSTAAALLVHSTTSQDTSFAIASTSSSSFAGSQYSSLVVGLSNDSWTAPNPCATSAKKYRSGMLWNQSRNAVRKSSPATIGARKNLTVKRLQKDDSLAKVNHTRAVFCSAEAIASISATTLAEFMAAFSKAGSQLDWTILQSSASTSLNLLSLCMFVLWMQRSGQLPSETPVVLSQVAFRVLIPCFLMSKVASTLMTQSTSNLLALPLVAVVQVVAGAVLGKWACRVVYGARVLPIAAIHQDVGSSPSWFGEAGEAIPSLEFTDTESISRAAAKKQALITAACAFGNSLTLPLVFLSGILGTEDANRAAGYLALYMVGWSPAMWTMGYRILSVDDVGDSEDLRGKSLWQAGVSWLGSVMNPPLYGCLLGIVIGTTPLSHLFLGGSEGVAMATGLETAGAFARLQSATLGILSPVFEGASLLGSATLAVQIVVLATSLAASLPRDGKVFDKGASEDAKPYKDSGEAHTFVLGNEALLDSKAFWVISLVRFILMPVAGILIIFFLQRVHFLPADPVYRLTILAEAAMPTAQNLVLLAQLNANTRPMAGMLAELLFRQYALSVVPITIWMSIFRALLA